MKHQQQKDIKKYNDLIAVATIKDLVKKDDIKKAIDICEKRGYSAEQFGMIAKHIDLSAEQIYNTVFK